jgi:helix-turn-helix protein
MKLFSVILFSLIVGGCSESSPFTAEKPENLLSETKFKSILSEITSPKKVNEEVTRLGKEILKKEGVDSTEYAQSFDYYASDKDKMERIYNEIINGFDKKIKELN